MAKNGKSKAARAGAKAAEDATKPKTGVGLVWAGVGVLGAALVAGAAGLIRRSRKKRVVIK